jgi:hypothetical protein
MKKLTVLIICAMLTGCSVTKYLPTWRSFPVQADQTLFEPCPDLKQIEGDQIAITKLLESIVHNYNLYYQCSLKNEGWQKWYKTQKDLWDAKK